MHTERSMSKNSFTLLEHRSIYALKDTAYALKDTAVPHYDSSHNLVVPQNTFDAIEKFYYDNSDVQSYFIPSKKQGQKALTAQNYVGVIQTRDGTTIEILPKITNVGVDESKNILVKMLKTLKKSPFKNFNMAHLKSSKMPLLEIFITMFLDELEKLIQRGIKSDYVTKEENLAYLKGKLNIKEQIRKNYIHKERFFVAYDEYVSDRVENRLIKTTLEYLYKKSKSNNNKKRIREYLFVFDEVGVSYSIKSDFSKVKLGRQMKDYELVLLWAKTFLLDNSYSPHKGNDIAFALLFDMNMLFESYVGHYFKVNKKYSDTSVRTQDKSYQLLYEDNKGVFQLRPDIVLRDEKSTMVMDTKWKILDNKRVGREDIYQLYGYGKKYKSQNLYLIYPKTTDLVGKEYNYYQEDDKEDLSLEVLFFDLSIDIKNNPLSRQIIRKQK